MRKTSSENALQPPGTSATTDGDVIVDLGCGVACLVLTMLLAIVCWFVFTFEFKGF